MVVQKPFINITVCLVLFDIFIKGKFIFTKGKTKSTSKLFWNYYSSWGFEGKVDMSELTKARNCIQVDIMLKKLKYGVRYNELNRLS